MTGRSSILAALAAALLFGASTPFAKQMVGDVSPIMLAGLLYLGSGIACGPFASSEIAALPRSACPRGNGPGCLAPSPVAACWAPCC